MSLDPGNISVKAISKKNPAILKKYGSYISGPTDPSLANKKQTGVTFDLQRLALNELNLQLHYPQPPLGANPILRSL